MPRTCTVCSHPRVVEINAALLGDEAYRSIARRFAASESAMYRHKTEHLPVHLVKAKEAEEVLSADRLIDNLQTLREETLGVLEAAKKSRDSQTMLKAIARAEAQLRLAAEMLGALQTKLHVQVRVRSFMDLSEEELQFLIDEAEGHARQLPAPE